MKYAIRNENGEHVRESRNHNIGEGRKNNPNPVVAVRFTARMENGYGVNRDLQQQKKLRREGALDRAQYRATLTAEQQLQRISERPGLSLRERVRLLVEMKTEESLSAVRVIIAGLREGAQTKSRKLGLQLEKQYGAELAVA
jgi:hypothetical protein